MNLRDGLLPIEILLPLTSIGAAAGVILLAGIVCDDGLRRSGRSLMLRHAAIVASLVVMLCLPALVITLHARGIGWTVSWFDGAERIDDAPPSSHSSAVTSESVVETRPLEAVSPD